MKTPGRDSQQPGRNPSHSNQYRSQARPVPLPPALSAGGTPRLLQQAATDGAPGPLPSLEQSHTVMVGVGHC